VAAERQVEKTYPAEDFPAAVLNITILHNSHFTVKFLMVKDQAIGSSFNMAFHTDWVLSRMIALWDYRRAMQKLTTSTNMIPSVPSIQTYLIYA